MQHPIAPFCLATLVAACATLVACGGGGDAAPSEPPAATAPPSADTPDTPVVDVPPIDNPQAVTSAYAGNCGVANFVPDTLALVNAFRARPRTCGTTTHPAAPALVWNEKLAQAAHGHSLDMATQNYFSHTSKDGRTFDQRITATGYAWSSLAENIAAGPTTMAAVMSGWQKSAGHCANLMSPSNTQIGLSCAKGGSNTAYATYWTMTLAKPR